MNSADAIAVANQLARSGKRRPRQADLKRAVSTAYYALFHAVAKEAADRLVGVGRQRPDEAWLQVYRALDHGAAKQACIEVGDNKRHPPFAVQIQVCAVAFVSLQELRHRADYDPLHRLSRQRTLDVIVQSEQAIEALRQAAPTERKRFAVSLLFKKRR